MRRCDVDPLVVLPLDYQTAQSRPRTDRAKVFAPANGPAQTGGEPHHATSIGASSDQYAVSAKAEISRECCVDINCHPEKRPMSKHVWISDCRADTTLIRLTTSDLYEIDPRKVRDAGMKRLLGETVPVNMLPRVIWPLPAARSFDKLPHFFVAADNWIVSRKAADIISRFDLGDGGLYPVQILKKDRKTLVEGEFLCLNVGAQKSAFLPERSPRVSNRIPDYSWGLPDRDIDDALFVSVAALEGPDLWYDPRVYNGFFMSEALGSALKTAGMAKAFRLYRCPVVEV
jgi:hypothetical protein